MNGTPTREELDNFIAGYNLRMKWNSETKKAMDDKFIADNDEVRDLIDDWLPTTIISEEDNNLPDVDVIDNRDPELYEYTDDNGDAVLELHTFSVTDCHHAYYHYKPNETEDEYKKKRMNFILNNVRKILDEYKNKVSEMTKQTEIFTKLEKMIAPSSDPIDISKMPIEKYVEIYSPSDKLLLKTNNVSELEWILAEVHDKSLDGYYCMFDGNKLEITSDGRIFNTPYDFTGSVSDNALSRILGF